LRILLVTQRFRPLIGGAESVLWELAREFARQGHKITVVTARLELNWPMQERTDDVEIIRIRYERIRYWGTWRFMRALRSWLLEHGAGYDIWYVSMLKHCAWAAIGASWRCHIPIVLRPEGSGVTGDIAWGDRALGGRLIRRRCRSAAAFVAIGPHVRQEMEHCGFAKSRIYDIANGVPMPDLEDVGDKLDWRKRLGFDVTAPLAVYVGRLSPEKGLADLIAAWQLVSLEVPGARLAIVGSGPQESELRKLSLNQPSIVWVGATPEPHHYLRAAELFVLPSYVEGMSIALLEAMAAAIPVVATDIPGNRAAIESGRHGLLVPPARPDLLAKSIAIQLQAKGIASGMARSARERVQDEFSITRVAYRHLELFQSVIEKGSHGRSR
jgi:glycosyltransferase involved in cell wall biosynthesis